jgi:hypothetical protein
VIFPLDRVAVGRFFRAPVRASSPSSPALTPRTPLRASRLFTADVPKYIFEGTEATESQRVTRGVLEHWKGVNSGAISAVPDVSAADIKRAQLKSSVGKALKFPPEILGDVYADPYPKRDRRQEARDAIARREASERAGELMKGWSQVAEQDKTMQSAFSAMKTTLEEKEPPEPAPEGVPAITDFFKPKPAPDGTITHFYKPEASASRAGTSSGPVPPATPGGGAKGAVVAPRVLPPVTYAECDNSVPANGALRNEAATSL